MRLQLQIFYEIVLTIVEEVGLANAIIEGRENDFVSEDVIFSILESIPKIRKK